MSKHLRFGKLLGMLAIMLTLSFAWSQAQNLSSVKQLLTFGFTNAANPGAQLGSDVTGVINQTTRTVAVTVPYQTNVTGLKAFFTSSPFSNVFYGSTNLAPSVLAVTNVSPAVNYTTPQTWTVEAENHSFENYVVTVNKAAASTARDMLSFSGAWAKPWTGICAVPSNVTLLQTEPGTFAGTNVTFPVPFGANLDALTVYFTVSPWATASHTTATAYDFDADNNGVPEAVTITVTSQSGVAQAYSVLPVVGTASEDDNLLAFNVPGALSSTPNVTTQTYTVVMPYSATSLSPTFLVSPWAQMYDNNPTAGPATERCSGSALALTALKTDTETFNFWIQAEDPSEVSQWIVVVTNAPASSAKDLVGATASYTKSWGHVACLQSETVTGLVGSISGTTVTFTVPAGVTSITLTAASVSSLGTVTTPAALPAAITPGAGFEIVVTAEDGSTKGYDVVLATDPISNNKAFETFGFHKIQNATWAFPDWTVDYPATIDPVLKRITVAVAWNTDLHDLIAYFTTSKYSSVFIAESNLAYTPQCSDVTVNDHSNNLTYAVRAADGTEERYQIIVTKESALTGNDLIGFKLTGLPYCYGGSFETSGTYTGTNIAVSVKYGTNLSSLAYIFTVSPGATVSGPASPANFTAPVTFTVTSQAGVAQTFTVTVTPRAENGDKKLLTYWFAALSNTGLSADAMGTVNEAAKTVEVWIPWESRAMVTGLKASFTLSTSAAMTHSEDTQVLQTSGVSANDFTTPVAYTVWAENCSSVEYFVTVKVIPNTSTGISAFNFATSGCGCDLVNKIDAYARRIYITLPYTMNISNLAPSSVVISPGATIWVANTDPKKPVTTAMDWTKGPVTYTVQSDAGATANWTVIVTNPACKEANIESWTFATGQVGPAVIDKDAHTVNITVTKDTNLKNMSASISLSCGATICCNMGACAGTVIDFSDNLCHTCVVTAQDQTVTQDWTICLKYQDVVKPEVTTWSVMAYNCTDSVAVQSNEAGRVFIVHESAIDMLAIPSPIMAYYNLADWNTTDPIAATAVKKLVDARLGAWTTVTTPDVPVYVQTHGLYSGYYWAFAVDNSGNISCISAQRLYLDICEVTVATLCDLRGQPTVWQYVLSEEIFVTYEETRATGNIKYMQTATCGILVQDKLGALPTTYGVGAGITGLKGMLDNSGTELKLIPVCCYAPTKSSTGNVVTPIELTYSEFYASCYTGTHLYESMLVKITTPIIATNDYGQGPNWMFDNLDLLTVTATGGHDYFIQSIFNSPLIGTAIPTAPAYYTGIRTNVNWSPIYGLITPRKAADITMVSGPILVYTPNPVTISGVVPGQCKSANITIYNEGATLTVNNVTISGVANITALYLDDAAATDGFHLVAPPIIPFSIAPWASQVVRVDFCPIVSGNKSTNLIVEYGVGKTLVIPINGSTVRIVDALPFCDYFNTWPDNVGSYDGWVGTGHSRRYGTGGFVAAIGDGRAYYINPAAASTKYLVSPGIVIPADMNDPIVSWYQGKIFGTTSNALKLFVSVDNQATWTEVYATNILQLYDVYSAGGPWLNAIVSLEAFKGKTVFLKWEGSRTNGSFYWALEDICIQSRITTPIIATTPDGNFGGVQVGATATRTFTVTNKGISVLKIKKVELVGSSIWSLTDANTYPVEITSSNYAYTVGNSAASITFTANVTPTDIGIQTAKIIITYGLFSDMTLEIPLTMEGLSCYTAAVANIGENWAPSQNTWFKYTADKFSIVEVNSCHPHQQDPGEYSWDTFLYVYADCEGDLIASHDDMEIAWCPYNRASSSVTTVVNAGETIYIFWPLAFPTSLHAYDGFFFNINVSYPLDGDVCENAIPLTLPVVNHFGSTALFNDDYDQSPCSPFSNYMDGNDKVYSITLPYEGYLTGNILGAYGSIHVLDVCPTEELEKSHCKAFVGGPMGGQFDKKIAAGTYYVIIATWAPPQTVDFLLNMSFRGTGVEDGELMSNLSVFPNPTNGKFTASISNAEVSDMTIELVNVSGQVVYRNEVKAAYSYNDEIDASQFAKGVYYLKVNNGKDVKIEKVVVQ